MRKPLRCFCGKVPAELRLHSIFARQGGHFRRAAACIAGQPIGLSGVDTSASARAVVQANFRMSALDRRTQAIRIMYGDVPAGDWRIEVFDQELQLVNSASITGAGQHDVPVRGEGLYTVRLSANPSVQADGSCCPTRMSATARIGVTSVAAP